MAQQSFRLVVVAVVLSLALLQEGACAARIFRSQKEGGAPSAAPAAAAGSGAPAGPPEAAKEEDKVPTINMKDVARLLPFRPDNQNFESFRARCVNFVNHMLERTGYDPGRMVRMMPECHWKAEDCKKIEEDLVARLSKARPIPAEGGGEEKAAEETKEREEAAGAPAPAAAAASLIQVIPHPEDDGVFGWCDTVWDIAHEKAMDAVEEEHIPAKAKKPLPVETGNAFEDAKNLQEWTEKNLKKKEEAAGAPGAGKAKAPAPADKPKAAAPAAAA